MGKFSEVSETTRKLITMVFFMAVILVVFTAVIGLFIVMNKPPTDSVVPGQNDTAKPLPGVPVIFNDLQTLNQSSVDGNTYVSMVKAIATVAASEDGRNWTRDHPDCRLYQAESTLCDIRGLSYQWSIVMTSTGSMLFADVQNGQVISFRSEDVPGLQVPATGLARIYDSNSIMGLMANNLSLSVADGNMLFSLKFQATGDCLYDIVYNDPASTMPYIIRMSATNGSIIESTYKGLSAGA